MHALAVALLALMLAGAGSHPGPSGPLAYGAVLDYGLCLDGQSHQLGTLAARGRDRRRGPITHPVRFAHPYRWRGLARRRGHRRGNPRFQIGRLRAQSRGVLRRHGLAQRDMVELARASRKE